MSAIEDLLPNLRGNISWTHTQGQLRTLVRANYYGGWDDTGNGVADIDPAILIDVEAVYSYTENLDLVVGVNNLFDEYPEENPDAGSLGQLYSESSPFGFNGGMWYVQARYTY